MTHGFDKGYWEDHWKQAEGDTSANEPNPYLAIELGGLVPGAALDAGCGEGAEAMWLAQAGWRVTAADISAEALSRASARAAGGGAPVERLDWVEADLSSWQPDRPFDLVTTHYAHPAIPQLAFYQRLSQWVAPRGTLLIVGHLQAPGDGQHGHGHGPGRGHGDAPPTHASVTAASVSGVLDPAQWDIVTATELERSIGSGTGRHQLRDVVVRATRRA